MPDDDFAELEERVEALAKAHRLLRRENLGLRDALEARERRVRELEAEIRELNQRRQDAGKRLGELVHRIDQLDARLAHRKAGS